MGSEHDEKQAPSQSKLVPSIITCIQNVCCAFICALHSLVGLWIADTSYHRKKVVPSILLEDEELMDMQTIASAMAVAEDDETSIDLTVAVLSSGQLFGESC